MLYLAMSIQILLLLYATPQYRYFLNLILFFLMFYLACIPMSRTLIFTMFYSCAAIAIVPLTFSIPLDSLTNNTHFSQTQKFNVDEFLKPASNSNMERDYKKISIGNLNFYSPVSSSFYWSTGNGQIPCVNKEQISFICYYFGVIPQKTGSNLKSGFYSKTVKDFN